MSGAQNIFFFIVGGQVVVVRSCFYDIFGQGIDKCDTTDDGTVTFCVCFEDGCNAWKVSWIVIMGGINELAQIKCLIWNRSTITDLNFR